jgi:glycosyltransferase involved in cell wall biosynthesis
MRASIESSTASLSNVRYLGHVDDKADIFAASNVFAFTSSGQGEGFPIAVLEAAAHGLPTVTSLGSGAARLVEEAGGIVMPASATSQEWAEALLASLDPKRSRGARAWAEGHDLGPWTDAHLEVFIGAAAAPGADT